MVRVEGDDPLILGGGVSARSDRVAPVRLPRCVALFQRLVRKKVACEPTQMVVPASLTGQSGTSCMVLGLLFGEIARFVGGVGEPPDVMARDFQSKMVLSLRSGFRSCGKRLSN